ncbi:MAG: hypothetical protein KDI15_13085 [Thiothrix sp.]|nr:hypothetical protein [Thiothrix sp.]HPE60170.1 PKD domain-containing protein [Thiolinea sp.]
MNQSNYLVSRGAAVLILSLFLGACGDSGGNDNADFNRKPVAAAGPDQTVTVGQEVELDGSGSRDADGDTLSYHWSVSAAPVGAGVSLLLSDTVRPRFLASVDGIYTLKLVVSDGRLQSTADYVAVTADAKVTNQAPQAEAGSDRYVRFGQATSLDAGTSHDPDGDALSFRWTLDASPADSVVSPTDTNVAILSFTPDVAGDYQFSVTVSDGSLSDTATVVLHASRPVTRLDYRVLDAEYSRTLDRLVMVATNPNRLYVRDPASGDEAALDLPQVPTSVSVSPDGLSAAVAHDAWVSLVDLEQGVLKRTWPVSSDSVDVVLGGNNHAYVFPLTDQWSRIHSINLTDGTDSTSLGDYIFAGTQARLHPDGQRIYGADNGLSPSDLETYAISTGAASYLYDSPYHGDHEVCGNLWISADGLRIFTRCGNVFRASEVREQDMLYNGSLDQLVGVQSLDHSGAAGKVLAIPAARYAWDNEMSSEDTELQQYDYDYLAFESRKSLPPFLVDGKPHAGHGRFVFYDAAGEHYYVILQADDSSGLQQDYGIVGY